MHRIAAAVFAALVGAGSLAASSTAVRAGDCPGMDDYRYDHGECVDASYDTSQIMRDMYHASDRLEEEREGRGRAAAGGDAGGGGSSRDRGEAARRSYEHSLVRLMSYSDDPGVTVRTIAGLAAKMTPAWKVEDARRALRARLAAYDGLARSLSLPQRQLSAPAYALMLQAYRAYDGESLPAGFGQPTYFALAENLVPSAARMTDAERQTTAEQMAIYAATLAIEGPAASRAARHKVGSKMLAQLGIDPTRVRLDQVLCTHHVYRLDCATEQWLASGGRMGRAPAWAGFARR